MPPILLLLLCAAAHAHDPASHTPSTQPNAVPEHARTSAESRMLNVRLVDDATDEPIAGLVRVSTTHGNLIMSPTRYSRATGISESGFGEAAYSHLDSWAVVDGEAEFFLPKTDVVIEAFSGLEYAIAEVLAPIDTPTATIRLHRFYDRANQTTGNVHLHIKRMDHEDAKDYATTVARADDVDIVFISYLERMGADEDYTSNRFSRTDLRDMFNTSGVVFGWGEEYRHNFPRQEGYGHVMLLDLDELILPASLGPDIMRTDNDHGTLRPGIMNAREQDATILWCHNRRGHEDIPSWIKGIVDGQIVFDQGSLGGYEDGFYRYLNVGLRVPLATGTDWFYRDMAMTYVAAPQPLTTESWLAALRDGKSTITNGPLITLTVNGERPGAMLDLDSTEDVLIELSCVGRVDFQSLELVVNGVVVARDDSKHVDGLYRTEYFFEFDFNEPVWIAARVKPFGGPYDKPETSDIGFNEYGKPLFAHTSPVYINMNGKGVFIEEAANSLIAEIEDSKSLIRAVGIYHYENELKNTLKIYDEAIATLKDKLDAHTH